MGRERLAGAVLIGDIEEEHGAVHESGGLPEVSLDLLDDGPLSRMGPVGAVAGEHVAAGAGVIRASQVGVARRDAVTALGGLVGEGEGAFGLRLPGAVPAVRVAVLDLADGLEHLGHVGAAVDRGAEDAADFKVEELTLEEVMHDLGGKGERWRGGFDI
ncbi:hypothetical protein CH35J_004758 [Colletotrichum higginsianum]|uniref:Uncharacterized protein n=1 Tax=Colletotrichum higginsianum TaxID=80884 RepID=A0A4T0WC08_9PEZI|nr:hypothetical protein CH35J_004758 [Colletotrichum higginsianum]